MSQSWHCKDPVLGCTCDDEVSPIADMVAEFHQAFGDGPYPLNTPDLNTEALRIDLLEEEFEEYVGAATEADLVEVADALADMVYVIYGTAYTYGIDLDAVLKEVHRSKMTKDFKNIDGKIKKGADYSPPDIASVLGL